MPRNLLDALGGTKADSLAPEGSSADCNLLPNKTEIRKAARVKKVRGVQPFCSGCLRLQGGDRAMRHELLCRFVLV